MIRIGKYTYLNYQKCCSTALYVNKEVMKSFFTVFILITGVTLVQSGAIPSGMPAAIAQDAEGCFMVNSSGEMINLSSLCRVPESSVPASILTTGVSPRVVQAKIKRRQAGTPVIDVTFNGKQQFEMLLDTGATQTTITPEMANALKLVPVGTATAHIASGEAVQFPIGRVDSIGVGGAVINNSTVLIGAFPLLGQNFFGRYDMTIKRNVVEFQPQ